MRKTILAQSVSGTDRVSARFVMPVAGPCSLQLVAVGTDLDGDWDTLASNDESELVADEDAADITAGWAPVDDDEGEIEAVVHATATDKQYVQSTMLAAGVVEVGFTPSAGSGRVAIKVNTPEPK